MSKRKLNRRQRWRIEKIQSEKAQRLQKSEAQIESQEKDGQHYQGLVIARHGKQLEVLEMHPEKSHQSGNGETVYLCHIRANLPDMVVGDQLVWTKLVDNVSNSGVIESLCERKSLLARKDKHGQDKIIAANVSQVFLVVACEPETPDLVIDRYLAACRLLGLAVKIIVNKSDLANNDKLYQHLEEHYASVVDAILPCSIHNTEQMLALQKRLQAQNSVFIGQSGVGKSSLVKTLLGKHEIKTQGLSRRSGLGQHTTSTSRLYLLEHDACIIDSPGIRDFDLDDVNLEQLQQGFSEFSSIEIPCKFRDCSHSKEPGCQIRKAVEDGTISSLRYQNYLNLAEQLGLFK